MPSVISIALPANALLGKYLAQDGAYTDCYMTTVSGDVSLEQFVNVFFDTWLFRIERKILSGTIGKPSTQRDIANLATGTADRLAAWHVEERNTDQLLLAVGTGPIRTWLMRKCDGDKTHLYFGSAILPMARDGQGRAKMGFTFRALLGFHKIYARALLRAAAKSLR
jgi:hypothetical protein